MQMIQSMGHIPEKFKKYINNSGEIVPSFEVDIAKQAEAFSHFTWEKSDHNILITDIQGVGYIMTVASIESVQKNESTSALRLSFCLGNCGIDAIMKYARGHKCNIYCDAFHLEKLGESIIVETDLEEKEIDDF